MPRLVSHAELCRILAEKRDLHRRAIVAEVRRRDPEAQLDETSDDLTARLRDWLTLAYVGPTGEEPRATWVQLSIDEVQTPGEGSGVYVVIDGTLDNGTPCAFARFKDPKDRDPARERSTHDELARTINNTLEQARIGEERANRRADSAQTRAERAEQTVREKEDEIRLLKDQIDELKRADDGGALGAILATALPYVQEGFELWRKQATSADRKAKDSDRAARAFELLGELAAAVAEAPGGRTVMRDRRVKEIAAAVQDEFGDEADDIEDDEAEAEEASAELVTNEQKG